MLKNIIPNHRPIKDIDYLCNMVEPKYKYIISDKCPADLCHNDNVIEEWKNFLDDCHVDYEIKYIVANDELKDMVAESSQRKSLKNCPEINIVCQQIDTTIRVQRIKEEKLKEIILS